MLKAGMLQDQSQQDRGPQAMESRLQMLRDLTTDRMGNSVLSDDVTLESLVPITRNLNNAQLEQCMNIAKSNGLNRQACAYQFWWIRLMELLDEYTQGRQCEEARN